MGQKSLNLNNDGTEMKAIFQIAGVTRPLMSVGRICDEGHNVMFDSVMAVVRTKEGEEICRCQRNNGGLYIAKMKLGSPSPAGFPGRNRCDEFSLRFYVHKSTRHTCS